MIDKGLNTMIYAILFEKITEKDFPQGHYYAHVPTLGLTTHGLGIEGARTAAEDLIRLWIAEKKENNEPVPAASEYLFSTIEVEDDAVQTA
jgi:predicted RNase H-like HicB family nuclease